MIDQDSSRDLLGLYLMTWATFWWGTVGTPGVHGRGEFVKVHGSKTRHSLSPRGLVRVGDLVYVALKGEKEGAIAKYKLEESQSQ